MALNKIFFLKDTPKLNKLAIIYNNKVSSLCIAFLTLKINWINIFNFSARIPSKFITTAQQFLTLYLTSGLQ